MEKKTLSFTENNNISLTNGEEIILHWGFNSRMRTWTSWDELTLTNKRLIFEAGEIAGLLGGRRVRTAVFDVPIQNIVNVRMDQRTFVPGLVIEIALEQGLGVPKKICTYTFVEGNKKILEEWIEAIRVVMQNITYKPVVKKS